MDTLFRLVSLQASEQQQQQSASYNSRSTTSSGSRSSSHQTNASYNYYYHSNSSGGGGGQYYYGQQHQHQQYYLEPYQQEECGNAHHLYMDEDFSSSSSSRQHFHSHGAAVQPPTSSVATPTAPTPPLSTSSTAAGAAHALFEAADLSFPPDLNLDFSSPTSSSGGGAASSAAVGGGGGGRWASQLLLECARAVAARDSQRVQQLMWMLNELASPYGDVEQKLSSYFLQGLFARLTASGPRTLRTLAAASDRNTSFDSTRRTALRFQELSPWSSFGHVAANGAILESFLEAAAASSEPQRFHILDLSNTFCTQWPTLLEALATRSADDTPHLSITTVVSAAPSAPTAAVQRVMREIGQRMEKFARLMGVPFSFRAVHHAGDLAELDLDALDLRDGGATTALAINCVNSLRGVVPGGARRRDAFTSSLRRLDPRVVTVVEEEADLVASDLDASEEGGDTEAAFLKVFGEGLRFFSAYMDSLEESFPKTSNERLALERGAGRAIVDLVSCPASESMERRETAASWARRMRSAGFSPVAFSEDVADDVRSLLRRYREGWSMRDACLDDSATGAGVFLAWKEQPLVWASAWRP
ncbi:Protein SHORT-ROOT 1 [Dichanthelium oligosanthes]|uniref:Protein SHORT-ROOT 1 n=1 Tax=Dichanthelium oligosanthes TaxID=888268 RepID=A0A1E5VLU0_9POAL|nr:Protein SHORT-ROOT 1 [Dichanthelium oligosanthes]